MAHYPDAVPAWQSGAGEQQQDLAALRELARSFCANELAPHQQRWAEQQHVDRQVWNKSGDAGLLCLSVPEEYGGGGGTFAHEAVLFAEQAYSGDDGWGVSVHSGIVAPYIVNYGTEEQKRRWLPAMASGEMVAGIAMTEPGTGSDLQSIKTKAIRTPTGDGAEYVLDGAKTFVTNGSQADLVLVAAATQPGEGAGGLSLVMVEADRPGFSRGRVLDKNGMKAQDTAELFFDGVRLPAENLLGGTEGQGFVQLMQQLPQERLIIGVTAVATMEMALAVTLDYVKQREAFGRPVFGFQNTKFELAECATEVEVCRSFTDDALAKHLRGDLDVRGAAMVKWWTTERLNRVVDRCVQLFGGYGYMTEYPIAKMWSSARVQKIFGGTNEIMKEIIARSL
jgi:acyl-CoA dehydrogenase